MKYKGLIFDLDGTAILNRRDAMPSDKLIRAVAKLKNKAIVSVATGRTLDNCLRVIQALGLTSPCIVIGGTEIIDPLTVNVLWQKKMSAGQIKAVADICKKYNYGIRVSSIDRVFPPGELLADFPDNTIYLNVKPVDADMMIKEILAIPDISAYRASSWIPGNVDIHITHREATKKSALDKWYKLTGLKKEEVIGVGDNDNDLPLFENVGMRVAVGNATETLKKAADYIAPPVTEDGLVDVINKFFEEA